MELAVYFSDLDRLMRIDDALHVIDPNEIPPHLQSILFGDDISTKEYYGNLVGLTWMELVTGGEREFSRLYFGQEFCEHLIPSSDDLEQAFFFARQMGWDFTYVTGYLTGVGLEKVRRNLARLAEIGHENEVVVNDWGVMRVLRQDFPALKPVLGRLLCKQKRMIRFNRRETPPPVYMTGIDAPEADIRRNQVQAYRDISLANPVYRDFLLDLGVVSADLDIVPLGLQQPEAGWGLPIGFYYPWGYAACGRNCPTAGVVDPRRAHVVLDGPCPRPCRQFNRTRELTHYPEISLQRGNTLFVFHGEYASPYFNVTIPYDRLIFEPYIPI